MTSPIEPTAAAVPERRPGHLLRYAIYQFRDYLLNPGVSTVFVMGLYGYLNWISARATTGGDLARMDPATHTQNLVSLLGFLMFFGTTFATNGIVSEDRKQGYYRFYFAKPIGVPAFYLQKFLVSTVGYAMISALLLAAYEPVFGQRAPGAVLIVAVAGFLLYGGIAFLASTAIRHEWLGLGLAFLVSELAWGFWGGGRADGLRAAVAYALPPLHAGGLRQLALAAAHGAPLDARALAWVLAYAIGLFLVAIFVLRTRRLAGDS